MLETEEAWKLVKKWFDVERLQEFGFADPLEKILCINLTPEEAKQLLNYFNDQDRS